MQFTINKSDFLDGIAKVQGISSRKTSFPITQNVLITAENSAISIVATDLEVGFRGFYPAQIQDPGSITIPGRKLFEIVKDFPSETIACKELENGWIEIADTSVQYQIVGMDPGDFPKLPEVSQTSYIMVQSALFAGMIEKTNLTGGLTSEEKRPHLIGAYMEFSRPEQNQGRIRMVSTDGNRLAKVDYDLEEAALENFPKEESGVILPKKVLPEMLKIVESGEEVGIGIADGYFILVKDQETLICRLVEGEYPDYHMVIPEGLVSSFEVEKTLFLMTLRRMSILCTERYRAVRFQLEKDKLIVRIVNPEIGESKEEMPISFNGQDFEVAFNPRFFIDAINPMKSDTILVRIESEHKPCIVEGEKDPAYLSVIMPMRM